METTLSGKHVAVIGGGPGGYPAAFFAADLGMRVTLIDMESQPGGVCLHRGCIPSKALLHIARVIEETKELQECGVQFRPPALDLEAIRSWKNSVVKRLTGGLGQLRTARKVAFVRGRARFTDRKRVRVALAEGGDKEVTFDAAIIATGSRSAAIPGWPVSPRIMDSTAALDLPDIPRRLLVVGGGYIGLELGSVYASLGSEVTVVEMLSGLLPGADRDLVAPLAKRLERKFKAVRLQTRVAEVREEGEAIRVMLDGSGGERTEEVFDRVLVSVGRRPNSGDLGLDAAGVEVNSKGFIRVDAQRRTSDPSIYAIGDVSGEPMLAHKATHEGRVAVEAIAGRKTAFEPRAIPAVVFTDPEIAWGGLTETQAVAENRPIKVARFPWAASGRALTLGRTEGFTKLLVDAETERVLGVGIVGPGAGELISEGVLAIEMGALASDVALTIHPHPTLSETLMEAAEVFYGRSAHTLNRAS